MPSDANSAFADELRRLRAQRRLSYRGLAGLVTHGKSYLQELETGEKPPNLAIARRLDKALDTGGRLAATLRPAGPDEDESEIEAIELARRVTASDVGPETLDRLERAVDKMAMGYATIPPAELLPQVRRHLGYVSSLIGARKTLEHQKRLLVVGGWLTLLRATLHIDLRQCLAADAFLAAAREFAGQAEHREIAAWCLETQAWDVLTGGDYRQALQLSQHAQEIAPRGGSAFIQATAQEGRPWARIGDQVETGRVLRRVEKLADARPAPEHPEHHYQYDPAKAHSYAATTLAWADDPAAEAVARDVITELEREGARPRRVASAKLDLGLALLAAQKPDEAAATATDAIRSGRIVASNWWRASEVVAGVQRAGVIEASDLREEYEAFRPIKSS
jgi:transcriptional regulator with XRE-family HTH domain